MDHQHFDALTRLFAAARTRRAAIAALLGATVLGFGQLSRAAEQGTIASEHRRRRRRGRRCKRAGQRPSWRKPCCRGLILDVSGRCAFPTIPECSLSCSGCCDGQTCFAVTSPRACGVGGQPCAECAPCQACTGGACVPDPAQNGICCRNGSGVCANGTCSPCASGQRCVGQQCSYFCDAQSCPHGCCDSRGICQPGNTADACGTGGAPCSACANPNPVCANGACTACNSGAAPPRPCPVGCCDAAGRCQPGTANEACGTSGTCTTCSAPNPTCSGGTCRP